MRYYLWPHGDECRLRYYLKKEIIDGRKSMGHYKDMTTGDLAYFCVTKRRGIVAFATLAGQPKSMPENDILDSRFRLCVELTDIHYINPAIKTKCPRIVTELPGPLPMVGNIIR